MILSFYYHFIISIVLLDIQLLPFGTIYLQTYAALTLYMFLNVQLQLRSTPNFSHCDHFLVPCCRVHLFYSRVLCAFYFEQIKR